MDDMEIRRAVPGDKETIMRINEVYEGLDYLEDYYDECFMDCPLATPRVAVYRGVIVGFLAAFLVDDGNTVVSRGGRTKPECSRRGFYKKLKQHCLKSSGASVNAFVVVNTNQAVRSSSFRKEYNLVLTRQLTRYNFNVHDVRQVDDDSLNNGSLATLSPTLLQHFMTTPKYKEYLFPEDRVIIDWVPFKLLPSNIPIIWQRDQQSLRLSDVKLDDSGVRGLMTNSATYRSPVGVCVCILDIYGTDGASVRRHVVSHVRFVCKQATDRVTVVVFTDSGLCPSVLEGVFREFGLAKMDWRSSDDHTAAFSTQCLFEKKIEG